MVSQRKRQLSDEEGITHPPKAPKAGNVKSKITKAKTSKLFETSHAGYSRETTSPQVPQDDSTNYSKDTQGGIPWEVWKSRGGELYLQPQHRPACAEESTIPPALKVAKS